MGETFRAGVGIAVFDDDGRVLAFERLDHPDAWQLPQGGLEPGEEPVDALWRELREETGLTPEHAALAGEMPEWLGYELPAEARSAKTERGQVQKWFFLRATRADLPIDLRVTDHPEFGSYRWIDIEELAERAVSFRQPIYRRLAQRLDELSG